MSHKDPAEKKAYQAKYHQEHKKKDNARAIAWHKANPEKSRNNALKYNHGITLKQYQKLWDAQRGLCAICGGPETIIDARTKQLRWLSVDHNHETGKVRALLCANCNTTLGLVMENPEILQKAIDYLGKYADK